MSNPVDPQTGEPDPPESGAEEPVEPVEPIDSGGIVVEVESSEGDEVEVEIEVDGDVADSDADDPVAALEARLAAAEATAQDNYDRLVRTAADLDNSRKRARRDVTDAEVQGKMTVLREILPVVDNLERAVAAAGVTEETRGIREGVELVLRQFTQTLEKLQVVRVEAHGRPFDPNVHEAVGQIPTAEHPPGTVVEVLQPGYTIGNRLLRAAMCVVASVPPTPVEPEPEPESEPESEPEPEIEKVPAEQASEPESGATEE